MDYAYGIGQKSQRISTTMRGVVFPWEILKNMLSPNQNLPSWCFSDQLLLPSNRVEIVLRNYIWGNAVIINVVRRLNLLSRWWYSGLTLQIFLKNDILATEELHAEQREDEDEKEEKEEEWDDAAHRIDQRDDQVTEWGPVPSSRSS